MSIKIAITDDHPLLIKGLKSMLQHHSDIVINNTYHNGKALLEGLAKSRPDILLLDIQMPEQSGDELARIITRKYPDVSIIALTNMEHEYYIRTLLQHNVRGYVLKSSDEQILLEAINTVFAGAQYFDPAIRKQATLAQKNPDNGPVLTRREKEVLELIARDYNSNDIAEHLFISKRTVDNHRLHLLLKLDVKGSASLVKKAIDLGLIK